MLIQQRALEEDGWICHATITPYFIITPPCLPVDLSLKLFLWFSFMWREPNSSTQSETDSILLNSECFCKHSQPSFPFPPSGPFLSFFPFCSHAEVSPRMSQPPHRLCCHHCSYFWALNRLSLSDHITQLPAESRQQLFAPISPPLSLVFIPLRHHPHPFCHSQFLFWSSRMLMFTVLTWLRQFW